MDLPAKIMGFNTVLVIALAAIWYIKIYRPKHEGA